jgi:hypothetical protein
MLKNKWFIARLGAGGEIVEHLQPAHKLPAADAWATGGPANRWPGMGGIYGKDL